MLTNTSFFTKFYYIKTAMIIILTKFTLLTIIFEPNDWTHVILTKFKFVVKLTFYFTSIKFLNILAFLRIAKVKIDIR